MDDIDHTTFKAEARAAGEDLSPLRAGLLFAREVAYPTLRPSLYLEQVAQLTEAARRALTAHLSLTTRALALADWLFHTRDFHGHASNYYDPGNSYLNMVLERRIGIPISLSVIYLAIGQQLHLPVRGIGLPGHFIVGVQGENGPLYLDPFKRGAPLTIADCAKLVNLATGQTDFDAAWLAPVSTRTIVTRMLNNLRGFYVRMEDWPLAVAVVTRLRDLHPSEPTLVRDLGLLQYRAGEFNSAIHHLTLYLNREPDADDADAIQHSRDLLVEHIARLN